MVSLYPAIWSLPPLPKKFKSVFNKMEILHATLRKKKLFQQDMKHYGRDQLKQPEKLLMILKQKGVQLLLSFSTGLWSQVLEKKNYA